ncbi:anti-sigma regulatory factor [Thiocystis violascens]|uniref:Anti-sigma regulatory factor (Ser/Thr protein kinase) n=1 Tax=Thiocystis violascens (strain ATCC 17096 / DSM 198 / 6111) TaxID=765911 RepID=I3Y5Y5_THIV6|nr:anti-sigma regulatory factor [Thiocystis violascens]AFL72403.1 anti-sigma regulatory factor (Ser/Thr protein kinase) [Thiocystis violascens DSM 198]
MDAPTGLTDRRVCVSVGAEPDIMAACRQARQLAEALGFSRTAAYHIATAASELAANLLCHAGGGLLQVRSLTDPCGLDDNVLGLELLARDQGPGIADLTLALTEGYSTGKGLGCGLPGVKRLMDDFAIESAPGRGTCVKAVKWR